MRAKKGKRSKKGPRCCVTGPLKVAIRGLDSKSFPKNTPKSRQTVHKTTPERTTKTIASVKIAGFSATRPGNYKRPLKDNTVKGMQSRKSSRPKKANPASCAGCAPTVARCKRAASCVAEGAAKVIVRDTENTEAAKVAIVKDTDSTKVDNVIAKDTESTETVSSKKTVQSKLKLSRKMPKIKLKEVFVKLEKLDMDLCHGKCGKELVPEVGGKVKIKTEKPDSETVVQETESVVIGTVQFNTDAQLIAPSGESQNTGAAGSNKDQDKNASGSVVIGFTNDLVTGDTVSVGGGVNRGSDHDDGSQHQLHQSGPSNTNQVNYSILP